MFKIGMTFKVYNNGVFNNVTGEILDINDNISLVAFYEKGFIFGIYSVYNTTIEDNIKYGSYKIEKRK